MDPDQYLFSWNIFHTNPNQFIVPISLTIGILFLLLSAIISAAEFAFFSLTHSDIQTLEDDSKKSSKRVLRLLKKREEIHIVSVLTDTFLNIVVLISLLVFANITFRTPHYQTLIFFLSIMCVSLVVLLFGEIVPQIIASKHALKTAQRTITTILVIRKVLYPIVSLMTKSSYADNLRMAVYNHNNSPAMNEISQAMEDSEEDKEMIEGIVKFRNIEVVDIMHSRSDMVDIDIKATCNDLVDIIIKSGYTRIPVYAENRDDIKGLIYSKDLFPHLQQKDEFEWQSLIRPVYFVPESKKIDDLLREFQDNKVHFAIVVDEYGGTSGLITMEDIIEEIVGDINDEYDEDENLFVKTNEYTYVFEGKILLNDFYKIADIDEEIFEDIDEEVETLAGLLLEIKGEMPVKKEIIAYKKYTFEILSVDDRRIKKIKLKLQDEV